MGKSPIEPWTVEEFLAWERQQPERYEYLDGVVRNRTGTTWAHGTLNDNLVAALNQRLKGGPCRARSESLKVSTRKGVS
jgi:Uma2 family endonuclease